MLQPVEHDHELVAANAGHGVGRTHGGQQPCGNRSKQQVTGVVTLAVVHGLHAIDVEEAHAHGRFPPRRGGERLLQTLQQAPAIRQAGERVVERPVRHRL